MRISYRYLVAALFLLSASLTHASDIVTREINSAALNRVWKYNVYLPTGYESGEKEVPVLYLLHGNAQNYQSWGNNGKIQATADALISKGEIPAVSS